MPSASAATASERGKLPVLFICFSLPRYPEARAPSNRRSPGWQGPERRLRASCQRGSVTVNPAAIDEGGRNGTRKSGRVRRGGRGADGADEARGRRGPAAG